MKILGDRLRILGKQYRYTQGEIANLLGMSECAYNHYIHNRSFPPNIKLIRLAEIFDTSVQYLVTGEETGKKYSPGAITPFPERVRELRKKKKMTQKQSAEELGIRMTAYQAYEYGQSEPTLENLLKLADLFGVTLDELLGRTKLE